MSQESGKRPIQAKTVVGHLFDAILHGRTIDLTRLVGLMPPPTKSEWVKMESAEHESGMDVMGDPEHSGSNGGKFLLTDFLRPILGDALTAKAFAERSDEEQATFGYWCDRLKWYLTLRRVGFEPKFASPK